MSSNQPEKHMDQPKYASLTAGLMARKGEAVPAAAAFTAEAIAQHIPARHLADEVARHNRRSFLHVHHGTDVSAPEETEDLEDEIGASELVDDVDDNEPNQFILSAISGSSTLHDEEKQTELTDHNATSLDDRKNVIEDAWQRSRSNLTPDEETKSDPSSIKSRGGENFSEDTIEEHVSRFNSIIDEAIEQVQSNSKTDGNVLSDEPDEQTNCAESSSEAPTPQQVVEQEQTNVDPIGKSKDCGVANAVRERRDHIRAEIASQPRASMRLDPRRYVRLSVAAAKLQLENQEVMLAALDSYLDSLDETLFSDCACMKKGLI